MTDYHIFGLALRTGTSAFGYLDTWMQALNKRTVNVWGLKIEEQKLFLIQSEIGLDRQNRLPYSPHPRRNNTPS